MNALRKIPLYILPALLFLPSCGEGNPIAPSGTILTISANPTLVPNVNGTSTITIVGRKPDGNPLEDGTEVRLSLDGSTGTGGGGGGTTGGGNSTVGQKVGRIDPIVRTDDEGVATATLFGDGRAGTAQVTANVGGTSASVTVIFGETDETRPTLIVSANPNNIPVQGTSTITIIARRPDGAPVAAGQMLILTTTLGTLNPSRPVTNADGTATSTLRAGLQSGTATITAILGSSAPETTEVTIRDAAASVSVQASPASIPRADSTVMLTAFVINSEGQALQGAAVQFTTETGTLQNTGIVFTDSNGVARNTLTVTEEQLAGRNSIRVTARSPRGDGGFAEGDTFITITQ